MRNRDKFLFWTVYFDAAKSRSKGRRIPRSMGVPHPKVQEVAEAAKRLGLEYEVKPEAAHPTSPSEHVGFITTRKEGKKTTVMKSIAREIKTFHESEKTEKERKR